MVKLEEYMALNLILKSFEHLDEVTFQLPIMMALRDQSEEVVRFSLEEE